VDAHNGGLEAENGAIRAYTVDHKLQIPVTLKRSWIRIRIKVKRWIRIRIRIKAMRIWNPYEVQMPSGKAKKEIEETIPDSVVIDELHAETGTLSGIDQLLTASCLICHS